MEKETLPLLYNEDGELITDPNTDDPEYQARVEAPIATDGICELTAQEQYILGYASYVLAFNPYKVRSKLNTASNIRKRLREHISDLVDIFIETGLRHPKCVRYNKHRNGEYAENWEQLKQMVWAEYYAMQKKTSTAKPKTVRAQYVRLSR